MIKEQDYLSDVASWSIAKAHELALITDLSLTDQHFIIIKHLQDFYKQHNLVPTYANVIKILQNHGIEANSLYLLKMFPLGITEICLISGLPKPKDCL